MSLTTIDTESPELLAANVGFLEFEAPLARIHNDIEQMRREARESGRDVTAEVGRQTKRFGQTMRKLYTSLSPWETVQVARHPKRPLVPDYIQRIFRDFCELHGDRLHGDDHAIITGFARLGGHKVMLVGHNKGRDLKERIKCNFGCAHPEGYRKALAKMKLAEKFGLPVVCLIDTQGAYPGVGAEERGIASAIAVNLFEMSRLRTPIVCAVIGEGGSGGALGIGVGDRVAMFQHSFYSVISPEGCAAILWKTGEKAKQAAEALNLTSKSLKALNLIDHVIPEPAGGAHRFPDQAAANLEVFLCDALRDLKRLKIETILKRRYDRLRHIGGFFSSAQEDARIVASRTIRTVRRAAAPRLTGRLASRRSTILPAAVHAG